jgi:thiamine biosynthesis protein ThiI
MDLAAELSTQIEPCVLLKLGEIVLKGRNRQHFDHILQGNIRSAVRDTGVPIELRQRDGVILLRVADGNDRGQPEWTKAADHIAERVRDVPGIARVCRPARVPKTAEAAVAAAVAATEGTKGAFAVRARRRDNRFPLTSGELAVLIGREIQQAHDLPVNLKRPGTEVFVEVDEDEVFVYTQGMAGQGGLPVGMSGRAVVLMSGGIDSPVAAYRMIRRGMRCFFLHFSGMPLTGPESIYKAYALVRGLDRFQGGSRLFVVPFGKAQQALASSGADRLQIVAQRRLMLKTGAALAKRLGGAALVTGDSLGQVSSQTLANITALDDAVQLPILRPLIGFDKTEIMAEARRIRTLAISELPDQDCCTLLTPRRVETKARIADLRRLESRLDAEDLAEELALSAQEYTQLFRTYCGSPRPHLPRLGGELSARYAPSEATGVRGGVSVRPTSGDKWAATLASSRRSDSTSACGPSHSADSGCGCTSTMMPSAPTAIAARDSGRTRSRRPPECDGSTITGRCESRWATGTALMSRVFLVAFSNVLMPRSHSTMSRLPRWAMYSAAISHSSMVAFMPRLSMTGLPTPPTAWSSGKFCMLRVPTWSMSA